VRGGAGQGSGDEKILNPHPAPHSLAKIQTVSANINLKTVRGGAIHVGRCGFALFCPPLVEGFLRKTVGSLIIDSPSMRYLLLGKLSFLNLNESRTSLVGPVGIFDPKKSP
jgi:hypothetical protein